MTLVRNPEPRFELLQSDNFSQYLLREKREIAFILRQLSARRSMVNAYYGEGSNFLITSVVGLGKDESQIYVDLGPDEEAITSALHYDQLLCMTQLDKIKIQFALSSLERTQFDGFPALRAPLPKVLLRLQRREYYRLVAPVSDSLTCQISTDDSGKQRFDVRVVDISGGGVAVIVPPNGAKFQPDMVFKQCNLILPEYGSIPVSLRVRSVFRVQTQSGEDLTRVGCQFLDLPVATANAVQRYILKTERERKAREG